MRRQPLAESFIARTSACGLPKASSGHPSINRAAAITAKGLDWSEAQTREFVASRKTANPHLSAAVGIAKGGDMRLGGSCDGTGREPISSCLSGNLATISAAAGGPLAALVAQDTAGQTAP